ncbi:SIS domain-containing protein [Nocardioides sp. T2.26MG-1]|uniref:SIS domain-containing protein n=1 Tax=Nocardioides sp. T2.26MG-1 TaxID=3041166 RepID=UPI002477615E|nr:SIS domain-containing protein [Nocardioides sp. T2.26MG-1]CAI9408732.1 D-galactosamine-6-phosphate deaminase AgaS [Nocardioides sp. T2.26MG-1]
MNLDAFGSATGTSGSATAREIAQQPEVWADVCRTLGKDEAALRAFLDPLLARPDLRIVLTGAGSSAFIGEALQPALTRALRRRVDAVATTDIVAGPDSVFAERVPTLLISFARSGESPESTAATALADQLVPDTRHLVVTCDTDGALSLQHRGRDDSLVLAMPEAANDRGFAMTSSFTSMMLATWLALAVPGPERETYGARIGAAAAQLLADPGGVADLVARSYQRVVYLGSGALRGIARESSLKMLELTAGQVAASYETALGFRHGPKAFLDDQSLAVVYLSNDPYTRGYDEDIVTELRATVGAEHVFVVSAAGPVAGPGFAFTGLDGLDDCLVALPFVIVGQLLGLGSSVALGLTPDNPFPDGQVNRVVQGVTVHPFPA